MSEILIPDTDKKTYYERNKEEISKKMKEYYELNKDKIVEKRKNDRDKDRTKYNEYMKSLTKKLYENPEWKKKRLEQKRIANANYRLLKRGDEPMKKRGRKPKVREDIITEITV
jgi:hypothetical protein